MVDARIAVDAMGGDLAPTQIVRGAVEAVAQDEGLQIVLVGDEVTIREELTAQGTAPGERLVIVHASQVVTMEETGRASLRKRDSSILKGVGLVRTQDADVMVGAGNTAAMVAAATVVLKPLPGVKRPGICVPLPTAEGVSILCDAGANIHCKPLHLYHYGLMASAYARTVLDRENPKVGLLNIGSEAGKGNDLVKETAAMFAETHLNFIGNCEGNDVFTGRVDVTVCEGFVGNVVLKTAEGLYEVIARRMKDFAMAVETGTIDGNSKTMVRESLQRFRANMDYAEHGGAPLLGLNGLVLISHGRSDARAMRNAIIQAAGIHRKQVLTAMTDSLTTDVSRSAS
ncbi:MAG: phosphate--acyl-ACP acyltransferase [Planctomycetes bacterium]|nr:phosphate--acyl-ACP acyltransferase [Planctomycetota bacterium]